jgi:glycosyltransferase involved in cell wall biosynthesis
VRSYLNAPHVSWEVIPRVARNGWPQLRALFRLLSHYKPELVHYQFTQLLGLQGWLAWCHGAGRIVFTDHSSYPEEHVTSEAAGWKQWIGRTLTAPYTKVVAVSEFNAESLRRRSLVAAEKIARVYNAVDLSRVIPGSGADFRRRYGIGEDRIVVSQTSWLIADKGIEDLLRAAELAVAGNERLHFLIVGEGEQRQRYERQAKEAGIASHVTFTGIVKDPMGEGAFAAADIACQMSRWEEAFGLVVAEAMALGKPVVATRVGGIPEVVVEGETGFLVERRDARAMADRILQLAADAGLRRRMGEAGRSRVEKEFDLERNAAALFAVYGI